MLQTYSVAGLNDNNGKFFEQEDVEASADVDVVVRVFDFKEQLFCCTLLEYTHIHTFVYTMKILFRL